MNKINIRQRELLSLLEPFENVGLILSNDNALNVVNRLSDLGIVFNETDDIDELDYLFDEETILLITKDTFLGQTSYYVEDTYANGRLKTIEGNNIAYIENGLLSDLEIRRNIEGRVVMLDIYDNDDIIPSNSEDEEEYDIADELDDIFEDLVAEAMDELIENEDNKNFCIHCMLKNLIGNSYLVGYRKAQENLRNALNESLENMDN